MNFNRLKNKIKKNNGETLIETLAALLIGVLALTMVPYAIVAAGRANKSASEMSVNKNQTTGNALGDTVTLIIGGATETFEVDKHKVELDGNSKEIYYYEIKEENN